MGIQGITKILSNSKTWQSLTKREFCLEQLSQLGTELPKEAISATKITGKYHNGSLAEFILFKDQKGKSLGSISLFPNGKKIEIDIKRNYSYTKKGIKTEVYEPEESIYTKKIFQDNNLITEQKTCSEVFKISSQEEKEMWEECLEEKFEDKMFQDVIKICRTPHKNGTIDYTQEVIQIETGKSPYKISMKSEAQITNEAEVTLKNVEQNGVSFDTSNPYFATLLMKRDDMLKATYTDIVKRRGLGGIEPPLIYDENSKLFTGKYENAFGLANPDATFVAINYGVYGKRGLVSILAHECEHIFTQDANIHRAGLYDMRSKNPISRRFYDGIMKRFKPIKKGTAEYDNAKIYAKENENYEEIVWNESGQVNIDEHKNLKIEKEAFLAGEKEEKRLLDCLNDFTKNFSLFNWNWALNGY